MPYFRSPYPAGESNMFDYNKDDHDTLSERFRKTLYYGKLPSTERTSLPLTDIAVELLQDAAPRKLGKLDHYVASTTVRENCVSPCTMMTGMIYVNRLRRKNPEYLQQISSSDLFLISMMMASKFLYDEGVEEEVFNDDWANSVDMETEEINQMERDFLKAIDWNLFVGDKEFGNVLHQIESSIALKQGIDRGWFTYTDLLILSQDCKFTNISQEISKVVLVSSLTYLTGILTMIGSTVLVTAASTALNPMILHSQIMPLPVTNVVPITDQMENTTKDEPLPMSPKEPKLSKNSIDYMLAELMAVVSFPTTFVKFWYSALEQLNSDISTSKSRNKPQPTVICSDGPCLQTSNQNCQNITKTNNGASWDNALWDNCVECQACLKSRNRQPGYSENSNGAFQLGLGSKNDWCYKGKLDYAVKCCCKQGTSFEYTDTVARNSFADVFIGFNTGFPTQVYVTT